MKSFIPALLALMLVFVLTGCDTPATVGDGSNEAGSSYSRAGETLSGRNEPAITKEQAKTIALAEAGVTEDKIREYEIELDRDNGVLHYDIEFKVGNVEYEYEIDAQTGDICEREREVDTKK